MHRTFVDLLDRNLDHADAFADRFDDVQTAQRPPVVTVCCSDSRVLQDHIWGNDTPGHLFTCGNIGNRVVERTAAGDVVSGDVLYPIAHTGTETVVVVGHTGCGAVTAAYEDLTGGVDEPPGIERCLGLLEPPLEAGVAALPGGLDRATAVNYLVEYNVDRQVDFLVGSDEIPDRVDVIGVVYDFQDVYSGRRGEVHVINVDGERDADDLRAAHPDIASRIERLWAY
ncbi:carbonic anhydrase [Haloplanus halophilus]|uniref:carbonic anhydrase n=1 Tax=Haloplanus halophilus TaxID=2949993 RepID=UPI00204164BC|nr:carbonic anhydrase [Haloplanus sp. GDY1]